MLDRLHIFLIQDIMKIMPENKFEETNRFMDWYDFIEEAVNIIYKYYGNQENDYIEFEALNLKGIVEDIYNGEANKYK